MSVSETNMRLAPWLRGLGSLLGWGQFWLLIALVSTGLYFSNGLEALLTAWQLPEYSHGPLIPVLSGLMFLKQLREYPVEQGPKSDRWPGVALIVFALLMATAGILANIDDIVAYALIFWIGGILLVSFGWRTGKHFWPGVVHLVFMLPLPGVIYYKVTTYLQFISSELGVWFLGLLGVPVFLDGNIIDLGVLKLHVAEACSGLRYMFPIMSFSYIFATLYKGPSWQKVTLLLAAVPIAIFMNSVRIAVAGWIVQYYGISWLEGFTHFFEGWVIFLICIAILFGLAWLMLFLHPEKLGLVEALDLDTEGLGTQLMRVQYTRPSLALITVALMGVGSFVMLQALPDRSNLVPSRDNFTVFPRALGEWKQAGPAQVLSPAVEQVLGADDYRQVNFLKEGTQDNVGLFMAWYDDQSQGGVHSPEICLPGAGWEIAWLERSDVTSVVGTDLPFHINRAIIQKGELRMMVYYWFQQKERRIAWDFAAKYWLLVDGVTTGRTDGALIRLTTVLDPRESDAEAEARLVDVLRELQDPIERFVPGSTE